MMLSTEHLKQALTHSKSQVKGSALALKDLQACSENQSSQLRMDPTKLQPQNRPPEGLGPAVGVPGGGLSRPFEAGAYYGTAPSRRAFETRQGGGPAGSNFGHAKLARPATQASGMYPRSAVDLSGGGIGGTKGDSWRDACLAVPRAVSRTSDGILPDLWGAENSGQSRLGRRTGGSLSPAFLPLIGVDAEQFEDWQGHLAPHKKRRTFLRLPLSPLGAKDGKLLLFYVDFEFG